MGCCQSIAIKRRRRLVKPMNVIPPTATKESGENSLTQGNRVTVVPLCSNHAGIVRVQEAGPESRVDLTHRTRHAALEHFERLHSCIPASPLESTPASDITPLPGSLSPVGQAHALSNMLPWAQQKSESDNNTACTPTPHSSAKRPAILSPPSQPQTHVIQRHYPMPTQRERPSSLAVFQHFYTRPTFLGSQRVTLAQQHGWYYPPNLLTPHNVLGPIQAPPTLMRVQYRNYDGFQEIHLQNPKRSGGSSDKECDDRSNQVHQTRSLRRDQRAPKVPRPTAALPSRRREWAQGLYDQLPPEECNVRRGTYIRGSDDSLSFSSSSSLSSSSSSFSFSSSFSSSVNNVIPPRRDSPTPPDDPEGMEIPNDPNILPRPNTRGGVAFDYIFEQDKPQTHMVQKPMSRRRDKQRKTRAELDLQQRLAELRRKQLQEELLSRLRACTEKQRRQTRIGMKKFMRFQLEKETVEKLRV